jgi:hypothetical protein
MAEHFAQRKGAPRRRGRALRPPRVICSDLTGFAGGAVHFQLDAHHGAAMKWMAGNSASLLTVAPVLTEASFFLPARLRSLHRPWQPAVCCNCTCPLPTAMRASAQLFVPTKSIPTGQTLN